MKKLLMALLICLMISGCANWFGPSARTEDVDISLKQGLIATWGDLEVKNTTLVEIANTNPVEKWGKWNVLWDGWSLDLGYPFDNSTSKDIALMLGREFGTLGKYVPINFPFKDKLVITIYPIGLYAKDLLSFEELKLKPASGGAFIKATLKF